MDMMLKPALTTYESEDCPKAKPESDDEEDWSLFGLLLDGRSESECEEKSTASALSLPKKERRSRSGSAHVVVHSPEKSSESPPPQKISSPSLKTSSLSRLAVKKKDHFLQDRQSQVILEI